MLSQELRPFDFSEMAGQKENIRILKAILKDPDNAPKCLIFQGAYGSGKTTASRILARKLNNITDRNFDLLSSPFYYEFDSTVVGNVEEIRRLRDMFTVSYGEYWRVVILDECHAISNAAQNALLKMLEETTGRTMYIMCTTEVKKLLPTIRSRSLELQFNPVPIDEIVKNLTQVSDNRQLNLSEEIKYLIAERSGGHMRNAHMLLDKYLLLGDKDFKDSIKSAITLYCNYLIAIYQNDKDRVLEYINDLLNIPKDNLQIDWNMVMTESLKSFCGMEIAHEDVKRMVKVYGSKFSLVSSCYMAQWMKNAFIDMPYFQATMLNMYIVLRGALGSSEQSKVTVSPGNANRFGRPVR